MNDCKLIHIYREKNYVADCLGAYGLKLELGCHYFDTVPRRVGSSCWKSLVGFKGLFGIAFRVDKSTSAFGRKI